MNRITQLIAMKRAHLVATQRSKRPRTLDQQAVSRIVKHAKKLVKLSSNNTSRSEKIFSAYWPAKNIIITFSHYIWKMIKG